ncbi:hypothetical protein HUA74_44025 [Myxococcus sp. CA051A]|uniref:hypothetical protein n=1 Tax=Myxococcus sp. CA051A TaxID=2741739 RepID=UPI00157B9D82|nr:hypothetical protein [Myxococcus sp. CA051A]NTX67638.1 hypothetical protein [Myxococcus sp. CA051A]
MNFDDLKPQFPTTAIWSCRQCSFGAFEESLAQKHKEQTGHQLTHSALPGASTPAAETDESN